MPTSAPRNLASVPHSSAFHRELFDQTKTPGGRFKESDNLVVDRSPDGTVEVRFVPVPAARTEYYTSELVAHYLEASDARKHHPVLIIGLFVLDLLTIHPFEDGNGRIVRALTNALLEKAGYTIGKYVSLEQLIAETADDDYATLVQSTHGWHDRDNDVWPWLTYFVNVLARAYERFEQGTSAERAAGSKQDRVREYVTEHAPQIFKIADIRTALPGISDPTIRLVLDELKRDGRIRPDVSQGERRTGRRLQTRLRHGQRLPSPEGDPLRDDVTFIDGGPGGAAWGSACGTCVSSPSAHSAADER